MAPANETRGEVSLTLEGVDYLLRASWEAIDEFEANTSKSLFELYSASTATRLTAKEVGAIAGACIRAGGRANEDRTAAHVNDQRIKELIHGSDGGLLITTKKLSMLLMLAVTGGTTASGEAKVLTSSAATPAPKSETPAEG